MHYGFAAKVNANLQLRIMYIMLNDVGIDEPFTFRGRA